MPLEGFHSLKVTLALIYTFPLKDLNENYLVEAKLNNKYMVKAFSKWHKKQQAHILV